MAAPASSITGRTRVVGVIGDPIEHSRSPAMHNAAFRALGLPWVYVPFRVASDDVAAAVAAVRALGLGGVNVTIPHKEAVLPHLDRLSARARACGAVNTIVSRRGVLSGENTDVLGLERDWVERGVPRRVRESVVIGAGGAARAVVVALAARSRRVLVAARRSEQARALVRGLAKATRTELVAVSLEELRPGAETAGEHLRHAGLVVNATSVGMHGEPFRLIDFTATPEGCFAYDLIYTAPRTPFLRAASRARREGANGLGMLLHQGAAAFELWTGAKPPIDVMRRALAASR
jgi:shikimate dehydrogenase